MKVRELIAELQKFDPEEEVHIEDNDFGLDPIKSVRFETYYKTGDKKYLTVQP